MKQNVIIAGIVIAGVVIVLAFYLPIASIVIALIGLIGAGIYWMSTRHDNS